MRVLLLAPGKSIHTHKWAMFYKSVNVDVKVVTFADHHSKENAMEVDTEVLPKMLPGKLSYLSGVFALKKIIQEFNPDLLHAHYISSYGFVGALTGFHPFYVSVWGRDIFQFPQMGKINEFIVKYTLNKADVICSTSHVMAKETNKYTGKHVFVTPFGVKLDVFKPIGKPKTEGSIILGTVKALSDKYGIADLIKAFATIHTKFPQAELLIVGDGPQRQEYEELAAKLGIGQHTTFTGRVPNDQVPVYINKMDIFAVPSTEDSESFGVAAVEAMACGVPPVVSNVGGLPEVVLEGQTGFVVPKEDPEKLAEAMLKLIEDPKLRQSMGEKGVEHVKKHYNWIDNANGMMELYNETLDKGMKS